MLNVFLFLLHVLFCYQCCMELVEDNVYVKPAEGPSNGHREEKDEKKPEEEKEATSSEGNYSEICQVDELKHRNFSGRFQCSVD